jgi:hypothetical protein
MRSATDLPPPPPPPPAAAEQEAVVLEEEEDDLTIGMDRPASNRTLSVFWGFSNGLLARAWAFQG